MKPKTFRRFSEAPTTFRNIKVLLSSPKMISIISFSETLVADNKLFLINRITNKKICLSVCYTGCWYIVADLQERYEEFFKEQRHLNPGIKENSYTVDYEHPFLKTPKFYQEHYLRRKFCTKSVNSQHKENISNDNLIKKQEFSMDFSKAVESTKAGARVTRPSWESNMYMWWDGSYCVHTHAYFDFQSKAPSLAGYFYVCEKDDATCDDWKVVGVK